MTLDIIDLKVVLIFMALVISEESAEKRNITFFVSSLLRCSPYFSAHWEVLFVNFCKFFLIYIKYIISLSHMFQVFYKIIVIILF